MIPGLESICQNSSSLFIMTELIKFYLICINERMKVIFVINDPPGLESICQNSSSLCRVSCGKRKQPLGPVSTSIIALLPTVFKKKSQYSFGRNTKSDQVEIPEVFKQKYKKANEKPLKRKKQPLGIVSASIIALLPTVFKKKKKENYFFKKIQQRKK